MEKSFPGYCLSPMRGNGPQKKNKIVLVQKVDSSKSSLRVSHSLDLTLLLLESAGPEYYSISPVL